MFNIDAQKVLAAAPAAPAQPITQSEVQAALIGGFGTLTLFSRFTKTTRDDQIMSGLLKFVSNQQAFDGVWQLYQDFVAKGKA